MVGSNSAHNKWVCRDNSALNKQLPKVTVFESTKTLTKAYSLDKKTGGLIQKKGGQMAAGKFTTLQLNGVAELCELVATLNPRQAIGTGINPHAPTGLITTHENETPDHATGYARTRQNFDWWQGGAGFLLVDLDHHETNPYKTPRAAYEYITAHVPALAAAPALVIPSSSSYIYGADGTTLHGFRGCHIYFCVADAADISRATTALFDRLQLVATDAGALRYDVTSNGALVKRGRIDASVGQPERLIFAGCPALGSGLIQRREPILFNPRASPLDTITTLPTLNTDEQKTLDERRRVVRESHETTTARAAKIAALPCVAALPKEQQKQAVSERIRALDAGSLPPQTPLFFADGRTVTAGDVAKNPSVFDGARLRDPAEPDYGNDPRIAVVQLKNGRATIFSHAHGGKRWHLDAVPPFDLWALPEPEPKQTKTGGQRKHTTVELLENAKAATESRQAFIYAWKYARAQLAQVPHALPLDALMLHLNATVGHHDDAPRFIAAVRDHVETVVQRGIADGLGRVTLSDDAKARHDYKHDTDERELTRGVWLINGAHGSGKTSTWGALLSKSTHLFSIGYFVAVTSRQTLAASCSSVLETAHYIDDKHLMHKELEQRWTVCLPSICKKEFEHIATNATALFIDELSENLRLLTEPKACRTDDAPAPAVLERLRSMIRNADYVVVADADLSDYALEFLESCRPHGERFHIREMTDKHAQARHVSLTVTKNTLASGIGAALVEHAAGGRPVVACESKKHAEIVTNALERAGVAVLCVHKDNKQLKKQAAFLSSPAAESLKYGALVYSPAISTGVSIVHQQPHFTHTIYIGSGGAITPATAVQMMRRVRYVADFTAFVPPKCDTPEAVRNAHAREYGYIEAALHEGRSVELEPYTRHVCAVQAIDDNARASFGREFFALLEHYGFTISRGESPNAESVREAAILRDEYDEQRTNATLNAVPITPELANAWRQNRGALDDDQHAQLRRFEALHGLGFKHTDELTTENLEFWNEGRAARMLDRFAALQQFEARHHDDATTITGARLHRAACATYAEIFEGIPLEPLTLRKGRRLALRISPEDMALILDRIIERRFLCAVLGIVAGRYAYIKRGRDPFEFDRPADAAHEIAELFEKIGIRFERVGRNETGAYGADADEFAVVETHAKRRWGFVPFFDAKGQIPPFHIDKNAASVPSMFKMEQKMEQKMERAPASQHARRERKRQACALYAAGRTMREVAAALGVGIATVSRWLNEQEQADDATHSVAPRE